MKNKTTKEFKIKSKIIISALIYILAGGTILFHYLENWSWVDSFYFTCVTITTIGYGDLTPTKTITKLLTVLIAFLGIGILLLILETMTKYYIQNKYNIKK
jgi:voltage-gated potassium channel